MMINISLCNTCVIQLKNKVMYFYITSRIDSEVRKTGVIGNQSFGYYSSTVCRSFRGGRVKGLWLSY